MDSLFNKYKWLRIVLAILLIGAGVAAIVLAVNGTYVINYILAGCCFIYAAMLITASFIANPRTPYPIEVLIGGLFIGIGIVLCIPGITESLNVILVYLIASSLIALGAVALIKAIVILSYKDPVGNWIFMLIFGIFALTGGILLAVFRTGLFNNLVLAANICFGSALIALGLFVLIYAIARASKKKK